MGMLPFASFSSEAVAESHHLVWQPVSLNDFIRIHTCQSYFRGPNKTLIFAFNFIDLARFISWLKPTSLHNMLSRNIWCHQWFIPFLCHKIQDPIAECKLQDSSLILHKNKLVAREFRSVVEVKQIKVLGDFHMRVWYRFIFWQV
jgi:hypothetical protein